MSAISRPSRPQTASSSASRSSMRRRPTNSSLASSNGSGRFMEYEIPCRGPTACLSPSGPNKKAGKNIAAGLITNEKEILYSETMLPPAGRVSNPSMSWSIPLEAEIADEETNPRTFFLPLEWADALAAALITRGWKQVDTDHRAELSLRMLRLPSTFKKRFLIYKGLLYNMLKGVKDESVLRTMPLSFPLPYTFYRDEARMKLSNAAVEVWEQESYPRLWIIKTEKRSASAPRLLRNKMNPVEFNKGDIIQKYIQDPVLIEGHKFHCRCYVVITSNLDFFLYKEGALFTALKPYDLHSDDPHVHFTNIGHLVPEDSPDFDERFCRPRLLTEWKGWRKERAEFALCVRRTRRALLTKLNVEDVGPFRMQIFAYDFIVRDTLTDKKVHLLDIAPTSNVPEVLKEQFWRDIMVAFILPNTEMINPADYTNWHAIQEWNGPHEFFVEI